MERKFLRNIFVPVYISDVAVYEKIQNKGLYCFYGKPNTLTYVRCKLLEWLGHVWMANGDD